MPRPAVWIPVLRRAAVTGTAASLASALALALAGLAETGSPAQPLNATSHWLHGEAAGAVTRADWSHTAVGYATHHAATLFWAVLFERWLAHRRPLSPAAMATHALALAGLAAATDYGATPKRFTPGWELVLSRRAMTAAYLSLAAGLAASGMALQNASRFKRRTRPPVAVHPACDSRSPLSSPSTTYSRMSPGWHRR